MSLGLLIFIFITVKTVLGVPHHGSEHLDSYNGKRNFEAESENNTNSDKLYKKEWDSYWESYYRNLMNKLNAHTYRGRKQVILKK